jgi:hypothetical protein
VLSSLHSASALRVAALKLWACLHTHDGGTRIEGARNRRSNHQVLASRACVVQAGSIRQASSSACACCLKTG